MMKETDIPLGTFRLRQGKQLEDTVARVSIYGNPLPDGSNVIWIIHALTANSRVHEWWPGMLGSSGAFDLDTDAVVCVNNLGSCYGSSGPASVNPENGLTWGPDFPEFSIRDMAEFLELVKRSFGWGSLKAVIGASMGGQIALQWVLDRRDLTDKLVLIASNAEHSSWGRAWNESQRMALEADPCWGKPWLGSPQNGLKAARAMALLSYRTYEGYQLSQNDPLGQKPLSYQRYQGEKLANRFDPYSYFRLTQAMDSHCIAKDAVTKEYMLQHLKATTMIFTMEKDLLFPFREQQYLYEHITESTLHVIHTRYGHDGFLTEIEQIKPLLSAFVSTSTIQTSILYEQSI